jgi:predicted ATPase/DNA-binding winged helix-turn-helix (wHTH) protein
MANHDPTPTRVSERTWQSYSFGPFEFFPERQLLLKGGAPVRVGGRALDLLTALVRNAGKVVTKRALIAHAWPSVVVDEANLKVNMSALRRALGDGHDAAEYIATVTGRGYRFVAPIQVGGDHPPLSASTRTNQASRSNLAIATTRILGRADVIESISRDLSKSRLISIVGPGGIGKTTVAVAIAESFLDRFPDGVWFVDLATIENEKLLPSAVAIAVGSGGQLPNTLDALCELLASRELLLILDSCEHMIDAVAACANRILASASGVRLLVTSREALMLSGERVRRLPSLAVPPASDHMNAREALTFSAIQLFVERATESCETFSLLDETAPIVADICRKLDGLALAIELAATRVDAFGVRGLQRQLSDRLLPLAGLRSGPERHRTLTATIEWSYGLLADREAQVLRAVSAFAGSFNAEGAAAVAGVPPSDATELLAQLAAKSLLSVDIDGDRIAYRLLETTRAFCMERLRQDGSHSPIMQRHARYICELLHRATSEWAQRPNQTLAANYDRVLTDLYAAICTSTMVSQALMFQAMDAMRRAVQIANDMGDIESQQRSLPLLGVYELFVGEPRSALRTFEKLSTVVATHASDASTESETYLGTAELFLGRLDASRNRLERLWERNLQQSQSTRTPKDVIATFDLVLPHPRWLTGSPDAAIQLARSAVAHASEQVVKNNALAYTVPVIYWCGQYEECRHYACMLETHSEKYGFYPRRPIARLYQAALNIAEGDCGVENIHAMRSAIEEFRIANHLARMPYHLCLLAQGLIEQTKYDEAATTINAALDSIRDQGEAWCLPEVLRVRARVFSGRKDSDGAEATLLVAIQKAKDIGALSWELRAANDLAALWLQQGRTREAQEVLEPIFGHFSEGHTTRDLQNAAKLLRSLSDHMNA